MTQELSKKEKLRYFAKFIYVDQKKNIEILLIEQYFKNISDAEYRLNNVVSVLNLMPNVGIERISANDKDTIDKFIKGNYIDILTADFTSIKYKIV